MHVGELGVPDGGSEMPQHRQPLHTAGYGMNPSHAASPLEAVSHTVVLISSLFPVISWFLALDLECCSWLTHTKPTGLQGVPYKAHIILQDLAVQYSQGKHSTIAYSESFLSNWKRMHGYKEKGLPHPGAFQISQCILCIVASDPIYCWSDLCLFFFPQCLSDSFGSKNGFHYHFKQLLIRVLNSSLKEANGSH